MTDPVARDRSETCEYCGGPLQEAGHFDTKRHRRAVDAPSPFAQLLHDLQVGCDLDSIGRVSSRDSVRFNHADDADRLLAASVLLDDEPDRCPDRCGGIVGHSGPHQSSDYVPPADVLAKVRAEIEGLEEREAQDTLEYDPTMSAVLRAEVLAALEAASGTPAASVVPGVLRNADPSAPLVRWPVPPPAAPGLREADETMDWIRSSIAAEVRDRTALLDKALVDQRRAIKSAVDAYEEWMRRANDPESFLPTHTRVGASQSQQAHDRFMRAMGRLRALAET